MLILPSVFPNHRSAVILPVTLRINGGLIRKKAGPARGNQGAEGGSSSPGSLNNFLCSSRTGALGEIGLSGRTG